MFQASVERTEPTSVVFVVKRGPYAQIPASFGRLYHWAQSAGHAPSGMPSTVYLSGVDVPEEQAEWELRAPLSDEPRPFGPDSSGLGIKRIEPHLVASALHRGPYDSVGPTYSALLEWIAENGYEVDGPFEEAYLNDPGETSPEEYLTEVRIPVRER